MSPFFYSTLNPFFRDPFKYGMDDCIFVNYGMDDRTLLMGRAVAHSHSHTRKIMASTSAASSTENSVAEVGRLAIHLQSKSSAFINCGCIFFNLVIINCRYSVQVCEFLKERGIEETIVKNFEKERVSGTASSYSYTHK